MGKRVTWERTRYPGIYSRPSSRPGVRLYKVYVQVGRRQLTKTFDRLEDARAWKEEQRTKLRRGVLPDPERGKLKLGEVYELLHRERPYAEATISLHRELWKRVAPVLGDEPIRRIGPDAVDAALQGIGKPVMREKARNLLSTVFRYAIEKGWLETSPVRGRAQRRTRQERLEQRGRAPDRRRYLTEEELARLLSELPERYRGLVELMARMGLRPGEAYALTVGKFDPVRRTLVVDTSLTGFTKTGEPRTLRLPAVMAEMLVEHLAAFSEPRDPEAPMFPTREGAMLTAGGFRRIFQRAAARAGLDRGLTPNDLRHSAASFAIAHGANVYDVQRLLGHSRASITLDVYGELWEEQHSRFVETLDEAIRAGRNSQPKGAVVLPLAT